MDAIFTLKAKPRELDILRLALTTLMDVTATQREKAKPSERQALNVQWNEANELRKALGVRS